MSYGVIDTTVIIHLYRKYPPAVAWLSAQTTKPYVTPITWLEVIHGAPGKAGQATCEALLNQFTMEYPTTADMNWAMQQLKQYRLSHGAGIMDCLIASVCHRLNLPILTHNIKHMTILLGSSLVVQPY